MRSRPRRSKLVIPEKIEVTLDRASEARFARTNAPISDRAWREAVGSRIADRARPVELERGILVVRAATNVWAHELSLLSEDLLARLRDRGLVVNSLRFRVGEVEPLSPPPATRRARAVPPPAPLPPGLQEAIRTVPDDELRETIADAAQANLAWQTHVRPETATSSGGLRAARAPRFAETGSAPQVQTSEDSRAASRCSSEASPHRSK